MTESELPPDGTYTVVVDSIEDGLASVFFEQDGEEVGDALFDASTLPADGRHADAILSATVSEGAVVEWTYEPETTETREETSQSRFDRLSSRPPSDDES